MKHLLSLVAATVLLISSHPYAYASDWDIAGKVLTGIAGMRILSGGKIDIVGTLTGVDRDEYRQGTYYRSPHQERCTYSHRRWVPHYVWQKKWVPQHREYDRQLGEIVIEGHYIEYKVQKGGHWEYADGHNRHSYHR